MKKLLILLMVAIFAFSACKKDGDSSASERIQIAGSTTNEGLTVEMSKAFKTQTGIDVIVRGGGSGRGIDGVLRDIIDIGNSSRDIKKPEIEKLKESNAKTKRVKIAIDGIVVVINKAITGVTNLDIAQVRDIFSGKITNWKQVGGPDKKIVVYTRDAKSGTGEFFNDTVLGKKAELTKTRIETTGNADLAQKVAQDAQAIGYVGFGFATQIADQVVFVKLSHKEKNINDVVEPTSETIRTMTYPISRYIYQFVREDKLKGNVKKFIDFMLSNPEITKKSGFLPVDAATAINDVF
jgi:phosphate transport system substrate-binding protein